MRRRRVRCKWKQWGRWSPRRISSTTSIHVAIQGGATTWFSSHGKKAFHFGPRDKWANPDSTPSSQCPQVGMEFLWANSSRSESSFDYFALEYANGRNFWFFSCPGGRITCSFFPISSTSLISWSGEESQKLSHYSHASSYAWFAIKESPGLGRSWADGGCTWRRTKEKVGPRK